MILASGIDNPILVTRRGSVTLTIAIEDLVHTFLSLSLPRADHDRGIISNANLHARCIFWSPSTFGIERERRLEKARIHLLIGLVGGSLCPWSFTLFRVFRGDKRKSGNEIPILRSSQFPKHDWPRSSCELKLYREKAKVKPRRFLKHRRENSPNVYEIHTYKERQSADVKQWYVGFEKPFIGEKKKMRLGELRADVKTKRGGAGRHYRARWARYIILTCVVLFYSGGYVN